MCWNLVDSQYQYNDITEKCSEWLDRIEETVSGEPRKYVDNTREVLKYDGEHFNPDTLEEDGEEI